MQGEDTDLDKSSSRPSSIRSCTRCATPSTTASNRRRSARRRKSRAGTVYVTAEQEGDHALIIADDGAGMDPEVLRRKAVEKGLLDADAAARLDESDCYNLIFLPGFPPRADLGCFRGGVGMDVVRTRFVQLNGAVNIESERGKARLPDQACR